MPEAVAAASAPDDSVRSMTEEELTEAIQRTLVAHGRIPPAEAAPTARMILGYFGPDESVLDNTLQGEDRDRFYWLEDEGLITSQEEDATVAQGRSWRIHYWIPQKARIRALARGAGPSATARGTGSVYESIADREWHHDGADPPR